MISIYPAMQTPHALPSPAIWPGSGVKPLATKLLKFKVGLVRVQECRTPKQGNGYFELRYTDPATGRDVKRRLAGLGPNEVRAVAEHLNGECYRGRGYLAGQVSAPEITEALADVIKLAATRPHTTAGRAWQAKQFTDWLAVKYPKVKTWDALKPFMLQTYVRELEDRTLAFDSVRLAMAPIKLAWRAMADNYPELVRPLPRIRQKPAAPKAIQCLEAGEVATLIDWLKVNAPDLWPMACLQGLAGLRCWEASALREQDINLKAGTISVVDTGEHKPKTNTSYRTIPVCSEVMDALRAHLIALKVRQASGELFTHAKGETWGNNNLVQRWQRVLAKAALDVGNPRLKAIPARKLRAAFATMAGRLGCSDRLVKAYLGHTAGDMLGDHYRAIGADEMKAVSGAIDGWRTMEKRKDSGNIETQAVANC